LLYDYVYSSGEIPPISVAKPRHALVKTRHLMINSDLTRCPFN